MFNWNSIGNTQSYKPPLMPPPSAFAYPYGEANDFNFSLPNDTNTNGIITDSKAMIKKRNQKKAMLIKRRKEINKILLTVKKKGKIRALVEEKANIIMELEEIYDSERIAKNNNQSTPTEILNNRSTSPFKIKSREALLDHRRCLKELLATSLLTKKKKEEVERELTEIDSELNLVGNGSIFDTSDCEFAEQLFGNVDEQNSWKGEQNPYPPKGYCRTEGPYSDMNCNSYSEQVAIPNLPSYRQENFQAPLPSGQLCKEISQTFPYTERLPENFGNDGFPRSNHRETTPGNFYTKESPEYRNSELLPGHPNRVKSPGYPNRLRSPGYSNRARSPDDSYREMLPGFPNRDRSASPSYRERTSELCGREESPSSSHRERIPIPLTDFHKEKMSDISYRRRSPMSNEKSPWASSRERSPCHSYHNKSGSLQSSSQESGPSRSCWQQKELSRVHPEDDHSDSYSHQHVEGEDKDLRVQLLFLREQKVKMELKRLEEASIETERKLKELHEKRLTEEVDDFLRKQSKLWRREDMKGHSHYEELSAKHGNMYQNY